MKGDFPPTTQGSMLGSTAKGWFELAQLEGSVHWRVWCCPAFSGCSMTTITTAFFHLLDSSFPEGWRGGGGKEWISAMAGCPRDMRLQNSPWALNLSVTVRRGFQPQATSVSRRDRTLQAWPLVSVELGPMARCGWWCGATCAGARGLGLA